MLLGSTETNYLCVQSLGDAPLDSLEGTTADEQDVLRVDMDELLIRMLAASFRLDIDDIAFEEFQHGLLDSLS